MENETKDNKAETEVKEKKVKTPGWSDKYLTGSNVAIAVVLIIFAWLMLSNDNTHKVMTGLIQKTLDTSIVAHQRISRIQKEVVNYINVNDSLNYMQNNRIQSDKIELEAKIKKESGSRWYIDDQIQKQLKVQKAFIDSVRKSNILHKPILTPVDTSTVSSDDDESGDEEELEEEEIEE